MRLDPLNGGDASGEGFGARQGRPFGHAVADLARGDIFRGHEASGAPVALHGIGIGEVLPHLGRVLPAAQRVAKDIDAVVGPASQRHGEPVIGCIELVFEAAERAQRAHLVAYRYLREGMADHCSRGGITQFDRFGKGRRG